MAVVQLWASIDLLSFQPLGTRYALDLRTKHAQGWVSPAYLTSTCMTFEAFFSCEPMYLLKLVLCHGSELPAVRLVPAHPSVEYDRAPVVLLVSFTTVLANQLQREQGATFPQDRFVAAVKSAKSAPKLLQERIH
jgi:hypothetical protein